MSIQKKVSINYAVIDAKDSLDVSDSSLDPLFKIWAKKAEEEIDSFTQFKRKIYVLNACNCTLELPCEVVGVSGVMIGDHGCNCNTIFSKAYGLYSGSTGGLLSMFLLGPIGQPCLSPLKWSIQDNKIVFVGNYDGQPFTIDTYGYQVDKDGWMMINQNHITAISAYIEYRYMRRFNHKKGLGGYPQSAVKEQERLWHRLCRSTRADDAEPTESEWQEIRTLWNDPTSGIQNTVWDTTNGYYKQLGGSFSYPW